MKLDGKLEKIFDERKLAITAEKCNAYAKSLYYWEIDFQNDVPNTIEKIITTNFGLG